MLWTFLQSFSFMPLMASDSMATNQIATKAHEQRQKKKKKKNISTQFQLHAPYGFWGEEFWFFLYVQIQI